MPDITAYIRAFSTLNVNRANARISPHKPVMLLSVLALAEAGLLKENKIYYNQHLLDIFKSFFQAVAQEGDACNPYFPFFHLYKGESFWHLKPLAGKEAVVQALATVRGPSTITDNIEYAYLDDDLFSLITTASEHEMLKQTLIDRWFAASREMIRTVAAEEQQIARCEHGLKNRPKLPKLVQNIAKRSTAGFFVIKC